jgi:hypothetical protein
MPVGLEVAGEFYVEVAWKLRGKGGWWNRAVRFGIMPRCNLGDKAKVQVDDRTAEGGTLGSIRLGVVTAKPRSWHGTLPKAITALSLRSCRKRTLRAPATNTESWALEMPGWQAVEPIMKANARRRPL